MGVGAWVNKQVRDLLWGDSEDEGSVSNLMTRAASTGEDVIDSMIGFPSGIMGTASSVFVEIVNELSFMIIRVFELVRSMFFSFTKSLIMIFQKVVTDLLNLIEVVLLFGFILIALDTDLARDGLIIMGNTVTAIVSTLGNVVTSGSGVANTGVQGVSNIGRSTIDATRDVVNKSTDVGGALAGRGLEVGADVAKAAGGGISKGIGGAVGMAKDAIQRPAERRQELDRIRTQGEADNQLGLKRLESEDRDRPFQRDFELQKTGLEGSSRERIAEVDNQLGLKRLESEDKDRPFQRKFELEKTGLESSSRERIAEAQAKGKEVSAKAKLANILGPIEDFRNLNQQQKTSTINRALAEGYTMEDVENYTRSRSLVLESAEEQYKDIEKTESDKPISDIQIYNTLTEELSDSITNVNNFERISKYVKWVQNGDFIADQDLTVNDPNYDDKKIIYDEITKAIKYTKQIIIANRLSDRAEDQSREVRDLLMRDAKDRIDIATRNITLIDWSSVLDSTWNP